MSKAAAKEKPSNLIPGATGDWEVIVGLEVHAQVASNAKLFSGFDETRGDECMCSRRRRDAGQAAVIT